MNNQNHNNHGNNNNHPSGGNGDKSNSNNGNTRNDWRDEVRETVATVAADVAEDARDLAMEAKEEVSDLARNAKAKFDAIPPAKKMEINHWTSILIAVVIGLIVGLGIGWGRGQARGMMMQNNHMSSDDMMKMMSANLDGLSGSDLEQQFLADMIAHHEGAIEMSTRLVGGADVKNDQLRAMAASIIRAQSTEIEQMKAMLE